MATTFTVCIDWDADGALDTAGDDITADVITIQSSLGNYMTDPRRRTAATGQLMLLVNNETRKYSPAYTAGALYGKLVPGRTVRLQANDGGGAVTIWYGKTDNFIPQPGSDVGATCTIVCVDANAELQNANISLPIQSAQTPKVILEKIAATVFGGASATGSITYTATPADGDTFTVGTSTYTLKTTLSGAVYEVLIGAVGGGSQYRDSAALHLADAINNAEGSGTAYSSDITRHAYVTAQGRATVGYLASEQDAEYNLRETAGYDGLACWLQQGTVDLATNTIWLYLKKVGMPTGTLTLNIYTSAGTTPSGTLFDANATATVSEATLGTSYGWVAFTFPAEITLLKNVRYFPALTTDRVASGVNYVVWGAKSGGGVSATKTGSTWSTLGANLIYLFPGTVEVIANAPGAWGNALALAETGTAGTVSGAALTGGTDKPTGLQSFEAGVDTITQAGDTWRESETNAMSAVQDVVDTEYGWFWVARDGTLTFKDRDWFLEQAAVAPALTLTGAQYSQDGLLDASRIYNHVTVDYTPREEATTGVVAQLNRGVHIFPNTAVRWSSSQPRVASTVIVPFVEASTGQVTGATDIILPVAGTDFTVNDFEDGTGFNYTAQGYVVPSMVVTGSGVEITFTNTALGPLWIFGLQVRGTALITRQAEQIVDQDTTSIAAYGKRPTTYNIPFASESGQPLAQAIANYLLGQFKDPQYSVDSILLRTGQPHTIAGVNVFSLDIGEVVTLSETQTGVTARKHIITAIEHLLESGTDKLDTRLYLRALSATTYWMLADATYGKLGTTTRLGLGRANASGYADGQIVGMTDFNATLRDDTRGLYYGCARRYTHFHDESNVLVGNAIACTVNASQEHRFYAKQTASSASDKFSFSCPLVPGLYIMSVMGVSLATGGKFGIKMDDIYTLATLESAYSAATTYNVEIGSSFFNVTDMRRHKFEVYVTAAGTGGGYDVPITYIHIYPYTES
jgi:hypothetical protein